MSEFVGGEACVADWLGGMWVCDLPLHGGCYGSLLCPRQLARCPSSHLPTNATPSPHPPIPPPLQHPPACCCRTLTNSSTGYSMTSQRC